MLILLALLAAGVAGANPVMFDPRLASKRVEPPFVPASLQRLLIALLCVPPVALYLESLTVAILAGRKHWFTLDGDDPALLDTAWPHNSNAEYEIE
jgi:hypothetical protein